MSNYDSEILSLLPVEGPDVEGRTIAQLLERAAAKGLPFTYRRAMHRALLALHDQGLVSFEVGPGRTFYWKKKPGASGLAANARAIMRPDEALALQLLERFAYNQMPALLAGDLKALFDVAGEVLARIPASAPRHYSKWLWKVAVEPGNFTLRHPQIVRDAFAAVSQALLMEHEVEIHYRYRTDDPSKAGNEAIRVVQPLGLVEVGGVGYLVAATKDRANPVMYRLDRMVTATVLDPFAYPETFSIESYIKRQRNFDFFPEGMIWLSLRFRGMAGDHLIESPMSEDQQVKRHGDVLEVNGTVMASKRLRWWVRSFGANVEVVAPEALRQEFVEEARALYAQYADTAAKPDGAHRVRRAPQAGRR
ncbi:transcriptional regulator [Pandoraea terrae]|uniref:Transcriptional regulator n=1 Tax=Pandoraea terrae TaxID=1537710 RepID=A0A5E4XZ80_9BURK|nr:WYL domain-containing protein [Pandoraea terrae]VVE41650.1 transcriptional regulator [Pandoraea terrae]